MGAAFHRNNKQSVEIRTRYKNTYNSEKSTKASVKTITRV